MKPTDLPGCHRDDKPRGRARILGKLSGLHRCLEFRLVHLLADLLLVHVLRVLAPAAEPLGPGAKSLHTQ